MKIIKLKYFFILLATLLLISSCSDIKDMDRGWDPDLNSNGAPSITRIAASADIESDLTTVALNQSIAIFGDNLSDVVSVHLNDIEVDLKQIYQTRTRLEIVVPRVLPAEVDNKIKIVTKRGEVSADIVVALPKLKMDGFFHDFAPDEDTVRIIGANFDLYKIDSINAELKFNGTTIKMIDCSDSWFSIKIPAGTSITTTSTLTVVTPEVAAPILIPFRERGIEMLTDNPLTYERNWWAKGVVDVTTNPTAIPESKIFKYYIGVEESYSGSWQWDNYHMNWFWLDESARDVLNNPQDYVIKIDMWNAAKTPLSNQLRIGMPNYTFEWDPSSFNEGVSFNTMGEWKSVAFEVTDLYPPQTVADKTGLFISSDPFVPKPEAQEDRNGFQFASNRESPGDVRICYWNIRIVKKLVVE